MWTVGMNSGTKPWGIGHWEMYDFTGMGKSWIRDPEAHSGMSLLMDWQSAHTDRGFGIRHWLEEFRV